MKQEERQEISPRKPSAEAKRSLSAGRGGAGNWVGTVDTPPVTESVRKRLIGKGLEAE